MCRHICRHLDISTHLPATEAYMCHVVRQHKNKCVGIFLNTSRMCQHLNALAYVSVSEYAGICDNTFVIVLTNMQTYPDADIYVDILRSQHECRHIEMPAYYSSDAEICVNTIFRVLANMPTYWDADIYMIYVNTLRCRHILLVVRNMPTYMHFCPYADKYADIFRCRHICWHTKMLTYVGIMSCWSFFYAISVAWNKRTEQLAAADVASVWR